MNHRVLRGVIVGVLILALGTQVSVAQPDNETRGIEDEIQRGRALFARAYDHWSDSLFNAVDAYFAAAERRYPASYLPAYWRGVVQFHLCTYYLFAYEKDRSPSKAARHIDSARAVLKRAGMRAAGVAEIAALAGTIDGISIYLNPFKAPLLGPKVMKAHKQALAADSMNPRVHYCAAMSYFHAPAMFGGGFSVTEQALKNAERLFQRESMQPILPFTAGWGHSTCLAFLGRLYLKNKRLPDAQIYFKKALEVNSHDKIAREGLAPQ